MANNSEFSVLLLGQTGTGKSTLGNFLIGEEIFEESDEPDSCTMKTNYKNSKLNPEMNVIDTPGIQDSNNNDNSNYEEMVKVIKGIKNIHLILIIFNFLSPRLTASIQYMIKFLSNVFPNLPDHLGIVFTNYDHEYQLQFSNGKDPRDIKRNKFVPQIMKLIGQSINKEELKNAPTYFIESKKKDDLSKRELTNLIYLAKILPPIENIKEKKYEYKEEKNEIKEVTEDIKLDYEINKIIYYIVKYKRTNIIDYNGKVSYGDWIKIDSFKKYEDLPEELRKRKKKEKKKKDKEKIEDKKEEKKDLKKTLDDFFTEWDKDLAILNGINNAKAKYNKAKEKNDKNYSILDIPFDVIEGMDKYATKRLNKNKK